MVNLNIKLEAPELMAALLALAEAMQEKPLQEALPVITGQIEASKDEEAKTVTVEEVKSKIYALSQAGKASQARTLLKKFGANKLSEMAVHNYGDFLKEAEAIQ